MLYSIILMDLPFRARSEEVKKSQPDLIGTPDRMVGSVRLPVLSSVGLIFKDLSRKGRNRLSGNRA
jgi:hypothetical protein